MKSKIQQEYLTKGEGGRALYTPYKPHTAAMNFNSIGGLDMSEVLLHDLKFSEGRAKVYIDMDKKLVKSIVIGRTDLKNLEEWFKAVRDTFEKFKKGELLFLHDTTDMEMRLYTTDQQKFAKEAIEFICLYAIEFACAYSKKVAGVYPSLIHQKSHQTAEGSAALAIKYFITVQEAMKWLLE